MRKHLPNLLTVSRIAAVPFVILSMLFLDVPYGNWIAFAIYCYAGITDFFDGYLARAWNQQSAFGQFLDPIADKLLIAAVLLTLVGVDRVTGVDILPVAVILCREILVSGLREFLAGLKVRVPVSTLAKWKTTIQIFALGFLIVGQAGPKFGPLTTTEIGLYLIWGAALITLITGYDYLVSGLKSVREHDAKAEAKRAQSAQQAPAARTSEKEVVG